MPATTYTANLIATALANGTSYQGPATVYLALSTTTPTATVAGTEVTLGGYTRKTFAQSGWTNNGTGGLTNTADLAWTEASANYDAAVVGVEAYTAATVGTRLWYIVLASPRTIVSGQTPKFLAGDLVLTVT
jgi:hypothetical protein